MGETTGNSRVRDAAKQCSSGSTVKRQWMAVQVLGLEHDDAIALELGCGEGGAEGTNSRGTSGHGGAGAAEARGGCVAVLAREQGEHDGVGCGGMRGVQRRAARLLCGGAALDATVSSGAREQMQRCRRLGNDGCATDELG